MSAAVLRLEMLRRFSRRGWQSIPPEKTSQKDVRALNWLTDKGYLEQHPTRFLTDYQITSAGIEYLAMVGGDVTGSGW